MSESKAIPEVEIELGGEKKKIVCSMAVLWRYQKLTKQNPFKVETWDELSPESVVTLIACCLHKNPEEHLEEVAEQIALKHVSEVRQIIKALFETSMPEAKAEGQAEKNE